MKTLHLSKKWQGYCGWLLPKPSKYCSFSPYTPQPLPSLLPSSVLHLQSAFLQNASSIVILPPADVLLDYTFSTQLSSALGVLADAVVICMFLLALQRSTQPSA